MSETPGIYNVREYMFENTMSKSITLVLYLDTLGLHFGYHECFKISTLATCECIIGAAERCEKTKDVSWMSPEQSDGRVFFFVKFLKKVPFWEFNSVPGCYLW